MGYLSYSLCQCMNRSSGITVPDVKLLMRYARKKLGKGEYLYMLFIVS